MSNAPELTISVHPSTASISASTWNGLASGGRQRPGNPFLEHAFFRALEESGCATGRTGWQPQHILISRGDAPVGLMPLFLKSHSMGEYVFDHAWADAIERAGGKYYPKLQSSVPFTPASAPKLLTAHDDADAKILLLQAAEALAERLGASSVHATFVTETEEAIATAADWLVRHDTQFHWTNDGFARFEDFLDTLQSRKRKAIRRERRDALADGITCEWVTGNDLTEAHWDAFYAFYMDTGSRKWGRPYLNREFFSCISASMGDRIVLMLARDGRDYIAGALNFLGDDTLYGRNWGAVRDVPFLHFELCYYQAIDFAIAHGLKRVEAGAQGQHKLARGYAPVTTRSIHHLVHPGLRRAVADYLADERKYVELQNAELGDYTPFRKG
ncbi:GNAT family N-acetyltransferase [Pelagibacterium lacus]|uniref:GNAT family N-acetyltransferase n=1 Tax=Pelagibacterium lacus TaxID=2282655 RepID=UPI001FEC1B1E|nr:GNAT family N-acetyltransferase [Pelagibacterium lacus]